MWRIFCGRRCEFFNSWFIIKKVKFFFTNLRQHESVFNWLSIFVSLLEEFEEGYIKKKHPIVENFDRIQFATSHKLQKSRVVISNHTAQLFKKAARALRARSGIAYYPNRFITYFLWDKFFFGTWSSTNIQIL